MPVAEIAAAVTGLRSALDITKAMVGLRDTEAFRAKSIELQGVILETMGQAIEAREAYTTQADRIRALETEVTDLKAWGSEKEKYELKRNYTGAVTYMLKEGARGTEPPHWLCPNCYTNAKKSFFMPTSRGDNINRIYECAVCDTESLMYGKPKWDDPNQTAS